MQNNFNYLMKFLTVFIFTLTVFSKVEAQTKSFSVSVSRDTILLGNGLKVEFTVKNIDGDFEGPTFKDFEVLTGPNTTSSMYNINGETSSTTIYSYYIKPKKEGEFFIENGYLTLGKDNNDNMETSPMKIVVLPNPQGILEEEEQDMGLSNNFFFSFPNTQEPKEERKLPQGDVKTEKKTNRKLKKL